MGIIQEIGLGPGSFFSRGTVNGRIVPAAALGQGSGQSTTVVPVGTVMVPDLANTRSATGDGLLLPGSDNSHFANWKYPSSAAIRNSHRMVVIGDANGAGPPAVNGGAAIGYHTGLVTALGGDTVANLPAGTLVTPSIADSALRGSLVPATTGTPVVGVVIQAPAADGDSTPQPMLVDFWGIPFNGRVPA